MKCFGTRRGFSLLELLVVVAILSLLAVLLTPAVNTILRAAQLNKAGNLVVNNLSLAYEEAVVRNNEIVVRLFKYPDNSPNPGWGAVQILRRQSGGTLVPITKVLEMPNTMRIVDDPKVSPLLGLANPGPAGIELPPFGEVATKSFRFRPGGALDPQFSSDPVLTIQSVTESKVPGANFFTLRINPITGKVTIYRP